MKKKRATFIITMLLMLCSSVMAMAASVSKSYDYGNGINAKVHGYVDFLEGPLTIEDRVYYNAGIAGSQSSKCTVAYSIIVDNKTKSSGTLDKNKSSVSVSGMKVGYGHEYAILRLKFSGKTKNLTSYAD